MSNKQNHKTLNSTYIIDASNVDYLYRSIIPELATIGIAGERSLVNIYKTAKRIVINIKASDIASCRATMNSWLRLALVAADVDELAANTLLASS